MIRSFALAAALFAALAAPSTAAEAAASGADEPPDYSHAASWVCRPGKEDACTMGLDAKTENPDGSGEPVAFAPAKDPAVDCFYVYPTVSQEQRMVADLTVSPEIEEVTNHQAGRLTSRCRLFAPVYRQLTLYGLRKAMRGESKGDKDFDVAFGDVVSAWTYYLLHDNGGRGVVLVGHSQGTILLQRLIATVIDGSPQQKLIVSAFLPGDPGLEIPKGKTVGGYFGHVPVCTSQAQTGCAYAWGSYLDNDTSPLFTFGRPFDDGMVSACVNPAAPGGGTGTLKFFHRKDPDAPASDPPWVETLGQITGKCRTDATGSGFIVSVRPGRRAARYTSLLQDSEIVSGWGLHVEDIALVQGNILDVLDAEIETWTARSAK